MPPYRVPRLRALAYAVPFLLVVLCAPDPAAAQAPASPPDALHAEIAAMDSLLFDAFNRRDLPTLRAMFARDLEFYHDRTGLTGYDENMDAFARLFARDDGLRRERVPGTLEVHPVPGHGAVAVGEHRFCHAEGGRQDCGTFPFVTVWRRDGDAWRVTRVVSYGH